MNEPLLSICIPTLNRAQYLDKTLESITSQDVFQNGNDIEIVISDNASEDNTEETVKHYIDKYGDKITYIKQEKYLDSMENFHNVLSKAKGQFLKLNNDTCMINPEKLLFLLDTIKKHTEKKPVLFFTNLDNDEHIICKNLNEFIEKISYKNTWSVSFGMWKEDLGCLKYFKEKQKTQLAQTYVLCKWMTDGRELCAINAGTLFSVQFVKKKGGYNVAEVFGKNYLNILLEFVKDGFLSRKIYEKEKVKLIKFINYYYFDLEKLFAFDKTGYFKFLLPYYAVKPYFYIEYLKVIYKKYGTKIFSVKKIKKNGNKKRIITIFGIKISYKY